MVVTTLVVPWLIGGALIALLKLSYFSLQEGLHLVAMGLLVAPMAAACLNELFSNTVRRPQPTYVAWGLVGLALVLALAWRALLSPPVLF
ncbi:hypothetical protein BEN47_18805 [Hymenobacter lapidarius]|uniref:Uncharacterized protein n=1 Tax=Hymenobacter lapidarius TaxID=1908237 RepID=A0A1G1STZ6_9BACT|nr:hypothetical protein [Hymenobacter lapidarius]OGX82071.1 hypothetical protein BEN47_18805 [Hymenobacter lapidarius]